MSKATPLRDLASSSEISCAWDNLSRQQKRAFLKKLKRKAARQKEAAETAAREEERLHDPVYLEELLKKNELLQEQQAKEAKEYELARDRWLKFEADATRREKARALAAKQRKFLFKPAASDTHQASESRAHVNCAPSTQEAGASAEEEGIPEVVIEGNDIIFRRRPKTDPGKKEEPVPIDRPTHCPPAPSWLQQREAQEAAERARPLSKEERDAIFCPFFAKVGACRFGSTCSRKHVYPQSGRTLLMKGMYGGDGMTTNVEEDGDGALEFDEDANGEHFEEFHADVHEEFAKFGAITNLKVCCNASRHLRGNVYVQYADEESAQAAFRAVNGRFYAGRQLLLTFVDIPSWRQALCGWFQRRSPCPRGPQCNFLHCLRPASGLFHYADLDRPPPQHRYRPAPDSGRHVYLPRSEADGGTRRPHSRHGEHRQHLSRSSRPNATHRAGRQHHSPEPLGTTHRAGRQHHSPEPLGTTHRAGRQHHSPEPLGTREPSEQLRAPSPPEGGCRRSRSHRDNDDHRSSRHSLSRHQRCQEKHRSRRGRNRSRSRSRSRSPTPSNGNEDAAHRGRWGE
ncbi:hypothetical protein CYMTET_17294 [Cymbomonas tetramitiformis]|uniref:Uncharacterized protein n=1 Tax=Cymbomonas tetramitiformis TaxID=36881 RepID=A0AAE0GAE8_9CHLO|nr:hypothetical protein CYMTET_17294 [Cymbomonas tetramitiformis]